MSPEALAKEIQSFLAEAPQGAVLEDGLPLFDISSAKFSLSTERDKCLLHAWSEERNIVRRVLDCERKKGSLQIKVQKFGAPKPQTLEIVTDRDQRSPSTKRSQRSTYQRLLARILAREFPGYSIEKLSSSPDLERSFGPIHARALVKKGNSGFAIVGVNAAEDQTAVDNLLTTAILWLHDCRERVGHKLLVEGVRIFAPRGRSAVLRARVAHLNHAAAKYELSEVEERDELVERFDVSDSGNLFTRLVRSPDRATVEARFAAAISDMRRIVPETEINIQSPTEVAFRFRGLEFARAKQSLAPNSFAQQMEITFGAGPFETALDEDSRPLFTELMSRVRVSRSSKGTKNDPLYRMQSERWLESVLRRDISVIDSELDASCVYSQVPAFAASDRAMIDVLTCTRDGRLAVLELKADEDFHLPIQGLDYWARVRWHNQRGDFARRGDFPGVELDPRPPLLYLVAPLFRLHASVRVVTNLFLPDVETCVVGLNSRWRSGPRALGRWGRERMKYEG